MDELPQKRSKKMPLVRKVAAMILCAFAFVVLFAEFLAPYDPSYQTRAEPSAPASAIRFRDADGAFHLRPFIYKRKLANALEARYEEIADERYELGFLVAGDPYKLFGFVPARIHLFGVAAGSDEAPRVNLLGTDTLGRDRFSRLLIATKFSLIVCPIGALLACSIGVLIGLFSGYANRLIDTALMGIADTMLSLPVLILILAARAAFPLDLPPFRAAMLLILIFAVTGWAEIARLTRGLTRTLKQREFVLAARSYGLSEMRILFRHILPNAAPTLITQATIMLPYFLLSEVALSFLGVGLQEPQPSLGNMLAAASDLTQLLRSPFLLLSPGFVIFAFVFAIRAIARGRERIGT